LNITPHHTPETQMLISRGMSDPLEPHPRSATVSTQIWQVLLLNS